MSSQIHQGWPAFYGLFVCPIIFFEGLLQYSKRWNVMVFHCFMVLHIRFSGFLCLSWPKCSMLMGFSMINHPFWVPPLFLSFPIHGTFDDELLRLSKTTSPQAMLHGGAIQAIPWPDMKHPKQKSPGF